MKLVLMVLLACVTAVGVNAQKKPNVVIMLADNVGYGAYGAGEVRGMPTQNGAQCFEQLQNRV